MLSLSNLLFCSAEIFQWEECIFTCPKLNKALIPPSNSLDELEYFRQLSIEYLNFPDSPYGAIWMSVTDAAEEGVWRDHYTGLEASQNVLEKEIGGLQENTDNNCGIFAGIS